MYVFKKNILMLKLEEIVIIHITEAFLLHTSIQQLSFIIMQ